MNIVLPRIETSEISLIYIGSTPQNVPKTKPASSLAAYNMYTLIANVVMSHEAINGTENICIVSFLPKKSANVPAGKVPSIAPKGIRAAIVSASWLLFSINGAEKLFEDKNGRHGDVHAELPPMANAPMQAEIN